MSALPDTLTAMHAEAGQPLTQVRLPLAAPGANDVLIAVAYSGLNRADLAQRAGVYPPPPGASPVLGLEVSGTVVSSGANVREFKSGDRVIALLGGGGYASHALADAGSVLALPDTLSLEQGGALAEALFTVWANVFDRAHLKAGETFLCHGATSGIGVLAIQMAKQMGATQIFATAGSPEKCALATELGATRAINYRTEDYAEIVRTAGGADVTLDMVGGDYVQKNISAAKLDGRIINIAYQNGMEATVNFAPVLMKRLSLMATTLRARPLPEKQRLRDGLKAAIWPHVVSGAIRPVIDRVYPAAEADAALARLSSGAHSGKILLAW